MFLNTHTLFIKMKKPLKFWIKKLLVIIIIFSFNIPVKGQLVDSLETTSMFEDVPKNYFHTGIYVGFGRCFANSKLTNYILNDNMAIVAFDIGFNQFEFQIKRYQPSGDIIKDLNFNVNWTAGNIFIASVTEFAFGYKLHLAEKFSIIPFVSISKGGYSLSDTLFHKLDQSHSFYNPVLGLNADYRLVILDYIGTEKENAWLNLSNLNILISASFAYSPDFYENILGINSGYLLLGLGGKMKFYFK